MSTYITGYDGSASAQAALAFTSRLAETTNATVIAANVHPRPVHVAGKGNDDGALALIEADARRDAERTLQRGAAGVEQCAVGASSPAEGLQHLAEERHAALLAVGSTHRGAAGRIVRGSVADHLLHGAPCPVLVVPPGVADRAIATVGVAYDARPASLAALHAAADLARRLNAELVVLAVHEPVLVPYAAPGVPAATTDLDRVMEQEFADEVREAVTAAFGPGADVRILSGGAPAHVLAGAARTGIDVLVVGSRGYGSVRGVLLGSVSRHLVDHAPCPVLVLPKAVSADVIAGASPDAVTAQGAGDPRIMTYE